MLAKLHKNERGQTILAVCDSELIGKRYTEGNLQLDLTSNFYKGEEKTEEEIRNMMKNSYIVNLVGEKSIALGLKENIIEESHIKKVDNIPHAEAWLGED